VQDYKKEFVIAMRSSTLLVFIFIAFKISSYAQAISNIIFIGTAVVNGGQAYAYRLQVNDSAGNLAGYSVTDVTGPNETRTAVKGTLNAEKKQIYFHETRVLSTKSATDEFCFIHARLKITKIQGATSLKGTFKGYKEDGKTTCASGKMVLMCADDVLGKLLKLAKKEGIERSDTDTLIRLPPKIVVVNEKEIPAADIQQLMPGKVVELQCPSVKVNVEIWDSKNIDGDKITLQQENVPILENFVISGTRKTIPIDMGKNATVTLRLIAQSEGSEPLNTSRIRITSGNKEYYVDATTTIDRSVRIVLKREGANGGGGVLIQK